MFRAGILIQWMWTLALGGEDARLKGWDMRVGVAAPVFANKSHEQGVCGAQSHRTREHCLVTGRCGRA